DADIVYIDPPYNQHPYGSNYFMLNVILKNKIDAPISKVSGIPNNWNRSNYNKKQKALQSLANLLESLDSKYVIISYNAEGFISTTEIEALVKKYGKLKIVELPYTVYRACRNLSGRDISVNEYLFILEKR
ncbi:hypothetical protein HMPREF9554_00273, partial [Treponema phagedenis F0421]|uniref:DNA adenine methylase n=1 Tax=Treponema phagedenis TaxID=162 RepID=UPI0001F63A10